MGSRVERRNEQAAGKTVALERRHPVRFHGVRNVSRDSDHADQRDRPHLEDVLNRLTRGDSEGLPLRSGRFMVFPCRVDMPTPNPTSRWTRSAETVAKRQQDVRRRSRTIARAPPRHVPFVKSWSPRGSCRTALSTRSGINRPRMRRREPAAREWSSEAWREAATWVVPRPRTRTLPG